MEISKPTLYSIEAYTQDEDITCDILNTDFSYDRTIEIPLEANDDVFQVDDDFINQYLVTNMQPAIADAANTHVILEIPSGMHTAALFRNLNYGRTTIRLDEEASEATFDGYDRDAGETRAHTIQLLNCHNLELNGSGIKVLDAYGNGVKNGPNESAIYIGQTSSCIDVHHWDIQNPSGFAGIMAKDSPGCDGKGNPTYEADMDAAFMEYIYIHHNYIHNIPQGEGIYAGDTGFLTGWVRGSWR